MMVLFWAYGNIAFSVSLFFYCKLLYNIDIDQFIVVVVDRPIYNANLLNLLSCLDMLTIFGYAHCLWLCSLAFCDIGSSCCLLVWRCSLSLDMLSVFMMPLAAAFMLSVFMMLQVLQLTVFRNAFMPLCSKFLITWQGADRHRRRWRTCRGATWRCTWARGGSGWWSRRRAWATRRSWGCWRGRRTSSASTTAAAASPSPAPPRATSPTSSAAWTCTDRSSGSVSRRGQDW